VCIIHNKVILSTFACISFGYSLCTSAAGINDSHGVFQQGVTDWQLPSGYFEDENLPMLLTYPRPDSETNSFARHRNQYPDIEYRIPVAVRGGAYPFKYELVSAPNGALIGSTLISNGTKLESHADYGVISWTPTVDGTYDFTVKVTDQNGSSVQVSWKVLVDKSNWVFIDDNSASGGDGSINNPFNSLSDIEGIGNDKLVILREGTHNVPKNTSANFTFQSNDPRTYIGYPDENVILNFSSSKFNASFDDFYFGNLVYDNMATNYANSHYHIVSHASDRVVWFENTFQNTTSAGTNPIENPACLFFSGTYTHRQYNVIRNNLFQNISLDGNSGIVVVYSSDDMVVDNNIFNNTSTSYGFRWKANGRYSSFRSNSIINSSDGRGVDLRNSSDGGSSSSGSNVEVIWNKIQMIDSRKRAIATNWGGGGGGPSFIKRNSISGALGGLDTGDIVYFENNVHDAPIPSIWDASSNTLSSSFDSNMNLTGSTAQSYLGLRGAEIKADVKQPKPPTLDQPQ
jgi:hypothetical protein